MKTWVVYTLSDPRTPDDVRYVGVTHQKPSRRLQVHLSNRSKHHASKWVRKVVASGVLPLMTVVHGGVGGAWSSVEVWWIQWHRERGFRLTNTTSGGEGTLGRKASLKTREKMRASQLGKKHSAEARVRMSASHTGQKISTETKKKIGDSLRGLRRSVETRAKMSASRMGWAISEETRTRMSVSAFGRKHTDETRAKMSASRKGKVGTKPSLETRARMSAAAKARCHPVATVVDSFDE